MSRWSNDFDNHPLHETLRQTAELLDVDTKALETDHQDELRRLKKVVENLREIVAGLDAEFVPQAWLDQINQHLRNPNFFQQVQNNAATPQLGALQSANNHITQYAPQIYHLAAMSRLPESQEVIRHSEDAFKSLSSSMDEFLRDTRKKLEETDAQNTELKNKSNELSHRLESLSTDTEARLSEWQSDFTEKQTARAEEYSGAQIEREAKFEELLSDWRTKVDSQHEAIGKAQIDKLTALLKSFKQQGEATLEDVREKHQAVLEIHKLVGRDSVAGGYQSSAGEEKKEADLWRWISMGALAAAVIWLGFRYWMGFEQNENGALNWANITTAASLTAILLVTAGYASRQSKLHRDNEKQMRSFALETKALDPFMASLEESDQRRIKAELIGRMFGQQHNQVSGGASRIDDGTLQSIADRFSTIVSQAISKALDKS